MLSGRPAGSKPSGPLHQERQSSFNIDRTLHGTLKRKTLLKVCQRHRVLGLLVSGDSVTAKFRQGLSKRLCRHFGILRDCVE